MLPECVNRGGNESLVRLDRVPRLEALLEVNARAATALHCWQARPGEIFTVVDPENTFYRARLKDLESDRGALVPFERFERAPESALRIEVFQALPEKERFELILQKLTELGVAKVAPFVCARSTSLEAREAGQKKSHRWPQVLLRAARQCRRAMLPELTPVLDWDAALYRAGHADLKLILCPSEAPWRIGEALAGERAGRVALFVGPEGGFAPEEIEEAQGLGFLPISVGSRILRTETAAIVAAALVQFALGDLG